MLMSFDLPGSEDCFVFPLPFVSPKSCFVARRLDCVLGLACREVPRCCK